MLYPYPNEAIVGRKTRDGGWRIIERIARPVKADQVVEKVLKRITFEVQLLLSQVRNARSLLDLFAEAGVNLRTLDDTHRKKTQYYMEFLPMADERGLEALEGLATRSMSYESCTIDSMQSSES